MREPRSLLDVAPVMPVISMRSGGGPRAAVRAAGAIAEAGLPLVQIALDAPAAWEAIERIRSEAPHIVVGAGALTDAEQPALARAAGAEFLAATTADPALRAAMRATELPHLPSVATVLDAIEVHGEGYTDMVLHPAAALGGLRHLQALAAFAPGARFAAAGGLTPADLSGYLAAPNVGCVIADWLVPRDAVRRRDWDRIRRLAAVSLTLSTPTVRLERAL
ncbi:ketohydroxyglutarate aldolase [Mycolicibacterium psychrotolerans]|uniref:ketohydroxyglutarate aldolase n=1 Tax=Mycolicibacterium psychrotolerans TaxID=216929 RepID=UPI001FE7715F|nr:ketohydroxyglutarate aldolase [Mycolicibacterium psychrotolerans]